MNWSDVAALCCLVLLLAIILFYHLVFRKNRWLKKENILLARQQHFYESHYRMLKNTTAAFRHLKHDVLNHQQVIRQLAQTEEFGQLKDYSDYLSEKSSLLSRTDYTSYPTIDAVIYNKAQLCAEKEIALHVQTSQFTMHQTSDMDIVIILFNLFDNAIESCLRSKHIIAPKITLDMMARAGHLILRLSNTLPGDYVPAVHTRTSKKDKTNHGYGLQIIHSIVKRYDGQLIIDDTDGFFCVTILMPL